MYLSEGLSLLSSHPFVLVFYTSSKDRIEVLIRTDFRQDGDLKSQFTLLHVRITSSVQFKTVKVKFLKTDYVDM